MNKTKQNVNNTLKHTRVLKHLCLSHDRFIWGFLAAEQLGSSFSSFDFGIFCVLSVNSLQPARLLQCMLLSVN